MQHGAAGRRYGIYGFGDALKAYPPRLDVVQDVQEVAHAAAEPVEFPDRQRVAMLQGFKATGEGRALRRRAAEAVIGKV